MFYNRSMAKSAEVAESVKMCTKCRENPKAGDDADANPWCQPCRTEYQREHQKVLLWRAEHRGIIRGILAMREAVATHFRQWGGRPFMGAEVASVVDALPGPAVADESAKPQ